MAILKQVNGGSEYLLALVPSHTCIQAAFAMLHVCICFASDFRVMPRQIFHKLKLLPPTVW